MNDAGQFLAEKLASDILITQGGEGMMLFDRSATPQRIPASRVPLADRAGAGDSSTAVLALCLAAGAPLRQAAELANKAAGVVVAKPGIAYVSPEELMNLFHQEISHLLLESVDVKQRLLREQLPAIESVVRTIVSAYRDSKTVYAFGNGGSAADANHFITELVGRFMIERKALPAVSFSTNEILMTSIANDYGYDQTFARQVDAFVRQGDLVVAFSTSGKSRNVVIALELARRRERQPSDLLAMQQENFPLCATSAFACLRTIRRGFRNLIWQWYTSFVSCWRRNWRAGEDGAQAIGGQHGSSESGQEQSGRCLPPHP